MSDEIWRLGASDMLAGLQRGDFSSRELVQACLARLEAVNPAINAVYEWHAEEALAAADAADRQRGKGAASGLLHGVPVLIKGNVDVAGQPTTHGCAALADNIAPGNSDSVQNWLDAGAVIIGRTNTPEFCCRWETTSELQGVTHNPWNRALGPGGSSGGSAAAIATGIAPLAHGTDLGGSLRDPAQACGIASIKPTLGRVADFQPSDAHEPGIGVQMFNTDGPMARQVADVRLGLQAMSAHNYNDPWWVPAPLAARGNIRRIALVTNPAGQGISAHVAAGIAQAGRLLGQAGYEVVDVEPPGIEDAADVWRCICVYELVTGLAPAVGGICGERLATAFANYRQISADVDAARYHDAFSRRRRILRAWGHFFQDYDLIVAPISCEPPMPCDQDLESLQRSRQVMHDRRMTIAISALSLPSAVVPVGISDGLPQAVQIIGPAWAELDCLAVAEAIEGQREAITPIDPAR